MYLCFVIVLCCLFVFRSLYLCVRHSLQANPTLSQLKNIPVMGSWLKVLSNFSYLRWTQEAFYLNEVYNYHAPEQSMISLYGYHANHTFLCFTCVLVILLVYRIAAFIALVVREHA